MLLDICEITQRQGDYTTFPGFPRLLGMIFRLIGTPATKFNASQLLAGQKWRVARSRGTGRCFAFMGAPLPSWSVASDSVARVVPATGR
jgi:hypothetical protein